MLSSFLLAIENNQQNASARTFPGPNGQIVFASTKGTDGATENFNIFAMNADGTGETQLTDNPAHDWMPSWSPDGTKIVFASERDEAAHDNEIYVMNADGTGQTRLTNNDGEDFSPSWSPDGTKIVFSSDKDSGGISDIYVIDATDGSGEINVSNSPVDDLVPSWSPDGTKIAYSSDFAGDGNWEIVVMNAEDGNEKINLSNNSYTDWSPNWSPDGTKIAFISYRDGEDTGVNEIYVMNAEDGNEQTKLTNTNHPGTKFISWSPDGTKIAFYHRGNILVMNADGTGQTNLTNELETRWWIDWGTNTLPTSGSDRTPPDTIIDSATDSDGNPIENNTSTTSDTITFEFSSPDSDVSEFQCSLDNAAEDWQDCTSPITYSNLAEGEHTFRVRAVSAAGNADPTPEGYVWTVEEEETTPPTTPAEAIEELITTVENLGDDVSQGTKTSLTAPLRQAVNLLNDDNPNNDVSACGRLGAFLNQVDAAERRGAISEQQASDLRTQAEDIRSDLGC